MKELEKKEMRIILASASPRRRELLSQLGVEFEVCPSQGEEKITEHLPELAVMQLAQQKAADIAGKTEGDAWILGADTIVVYDQKILGKPKDEEDAKRMLGMLQNHRHQVYTGVCIWKKENGSEEIRCFYEKTDVVFLSDDGRRNSKICGYRGTDGQGRFLWNSGHRWSVRP